MSTNGLARLNNKFNKKLSDVQISLWAMLIFSFLILLALALIGIILSSVLWTETSGNATICNNCPGIVNFVFTDNGTLSPIQNQSLKFNGKSGIKVTLELPDIITIDNLRDLTNYTVDCNGGSEFLTPQEAYHKALLDGKGGNNGEFEAIIIISPCRYDFGTTQFEINTSNIIWSSLSTFTGLTNGVIFTSSGPSGGIHVSLPVDSNQFMIFQGISFGDVGDSTNGFVLNVTKGQCVMSECGCADTNFRIFLGGEGITFLSSYDSSFRPLPPNDFITTIDSNTLIIFHDTQIIQVGTGSPGGSIFNYNNGITQSRMFNLFILFDAYTNVYNGPIAGAIGEGTIQVERATIIANDIGLFPYFIKQNGPFNLEIFGSTMTLQGPLVYQNTDSTSGDVHNVILANSYITSKNTTFFIEPTVSVIGQNNYEISNSRLTVTVDLYFINIVSASGTDTLIVILVGTTTKTTQAPLGVSAVGVPAFSTFTTGGSFSLNGANAISGFVYIPLTSF